MAISFRRRFLHGVFFGVVGALALVTMLGQPTALSLATSTLQLFSGEVDTVGELPLRRSATPKYPASHGALRAWGHRTSLKHNLRPDKHYFISFLGFGWNNQVIAAMNLIHIAHLSERIPILPPFRTWDWRGQHELPVGDVFDLTRLSAALTGLPVVELSELKASPGMPSNYSDEDLAKLRKQALRSTHGKHSGKIFTQSPHVDEIGCWSFWRGKFGEGGGAFTGNDYLQYYHADGLGERVQTLDFIELIKPHRHYARPASSQQFIKDNSLEEPLRDPEDHVMCLDHAYNFGIQPRYDVREEYRRGGPAWGMVGRAMHYQPKWKSMAEEYLREIFEVAEDDFIPQYIAIHIRRGDFPDEWHRLTTDHYAFATHTVQTLLRERTGVEVTHVLITTDEKDEAWLNELRAFKGFHVVNHKELGIDADDVWKPPILDAMFLSFAVGFVGSEASTMSILAERRVVEWQGGVGLLINPFRLEIPPEWENPFAIQD